MRPDGFGGSLLSGTFLDHDLAAMLPIPPANRLDRVRRACRRIVLDAERQVGPASGARAVVEVLFAPLMRLLGYGLTTPSADPASGSQLVTLTARRDLELAASVRSWNDRSRGWWHRAVTHSLSLGSRWVISCNGPSLTILDAGQPHAPRALDIDLRRAVEHDEGFRRLWSLLQPSAFDGHRQRQSRFDAIERACLRAGMRVCQALEQGVRDGLALLIAGLQAPRARGRAPREEALSALHEQGLTMIYRMLFLLFAEAHGLVPLWHPTYRRSYSMVALRELVEAPESSRGLWLALRAMSRLAHAGCAIGSLQVVAFNGRLFEPARTPLAESVPLSDDRMRKVLLALTTLPGARRSTIVPGARGRQRIAFGELGVEQLGAVYERVLDYVPVLQGRRCVLTPAKSGPRKTTATFYTPSALTDHLVRATLDPLIRKRPAARILELRVLDPAMGSGAFLVAACRHLAGAYEHACAEDGTEPTPFSESRRAQVRRLIAQRCLFGVDLNPMAVQLARLSLWLTTLASGEPLTFLDHHIRVGNSLVGTTFDCVLTRRHGPGSGVRRETPLFEAAEWADAFRQVLPDRLQLEAQPDSTVQVVQEKERAVDRLSSRGSPLGPWRAVFDSWCAPSFWPDERQPLTAAAAGELAAWHLGRRVALSQITLRSLAERVAGIAARHHFFHWQLEFPEVFVAPEGCLTADGGFDAIVGNPPWTMVRNRAAGDRSGLAAGALARFARASGLRSGRDAHTNTYQLFVDRAISLLRRGGRLGMVVPWGLFGDHGAAEERRHLFEHTSVDTLISFDNRETIFPIHRDLRFALFTTTAAGRTSSVACRLGLRRLADLDTPPGSDDTRSIEISTAFLSRTSGERLAIPAVRDRADVAMLDDLTARLLPLGDGRGWGARFGRELNASDDRPHFLPKGAGLPIVEGKMIHPFHVRLDEHSQAIDAALAHRRLGAAVGRPRLAFRDIASPTNRLSLIAAILPAGTVSTHTVFCLKNLWPISRQRVLCGLLNSLVANYLVRLRMSTHVTTALIHWLPAPLTGPHDSLAQRLAAEVERLEAAPDGSDIELQALAARAYGLDPARLSHVLDSFPLVDRTHRDRILRRVEEGLR